MSIVVVILAGGEGRRIGGDKPLRLLSGRTLLDWAIANAAQWSPMLVVAVRGDAQAGGVEVPLIRDESGVEGPLAGLLAALRFGSTEGAEAMLTIPSDMPFLPADLATRLQAELGDNHAALAASAGHLHPVCGLWRTSCLASAPHYLASGQRSLKGFARAVGFATVEWAAGDADPFFNINDQGDLAEAELRLRA